MAPRPPAVHPELSSPLKGGEALHHALYAGLFTLNQVRGPLHPQPGFFLSLFFFFHPQPGAHAGARHALPAPAATPLAARDTAASPPPAPAAVRALRAAAAAAQFGACSACPRCVAVSAQPGNTLCPTCMVRFDQASWKCASLVTPRISFSWFGPLCLWPMPCRCCEPPPTRLPGLSSPRACGTPWPPLQASGAAGWPPLSSPCVAQHASTATLPSGGARCCTFCPALDCPPPSGLAARQPRRAPAAPPTPPPRRAPPRWPPRSMRPQLVLLLSCLLPVEARLSYLALRHEAYSHAAPDVRDLGGLVKSVLLRMMLYVRGGGGGGLWGHACLGMCLCGGCSREGSVGACDAGIWLRGGCSKEGSVGACFCGHAPPRWWMQRAGGMPSGGCARCGLSPLPGRADPAVAHLLPLAPVSWQTSPCIGIPTACRWRSPPTTPPRRQPVHRRPQSPPPPNPSPTPPHLPCSPSAAPTCPGCASSSRRCAPPAPPPSPSGCCAAAPPAAAPRG